MKKLLITIVLIIASLISSYASEITRNPEGATIERVEGNKGTPTGLYIETKSGGKYPIYVGSKGGMYYYCRAQKGKHAGEIQKRYLNKEDKQKALQMLGK